MSGWPFEKIQRAIDGAINAGVSPKAMAVLVTTGALNPIHKGHVAMLTASQEALAKEGITVVGGFVSPSHDMYLSGKFGRGKFMPSPNRLKLAQLAVDDESLWSVGEWESKVHGYWPDFPEVAASLRDAVADVFPGVAVYYVCGVDHSKKCGLERSGVGKGIGLCVVARSGVLPQRHPGSMPFHYVSVPALSVEMESYSSTAVRTALKDNDTATLQQMLHPAVMRELSTS
jgi:hypothetical protein